jgi:hypothetical protein
MEPVKIANRLTISSYEHAHITALGFAYRTAHGTVEAIGQFLNGAAQIQRMPAKFCNRTGGGLK